jgi:hypothetical protein
VSEFKIMNNDKDKQNADLYAQLGLSNPLLDLNSLGIPTTGITATNGNMLDMTRQSGVPDSVA